MAPRIPNTSHVDHAAIHARALELRRAELARLQANAGRALRDAINNLVATARHTVERVRRANVFFFGAQ